MHEQGLVLDHSIGRNLALPDLKDLDMFGLFHRNESAARARATIGGSRSLQTCGGVIGCDGAASVPAASGDKPSFMFECSCGHVHFIFLFQLKPKNACG